MVRQRISECKTLGKIISGVKNGKYRVEVICPRCGNKHLHRDVSAGDVRFCDRGDGRYQILLIREHAQTTGYLSFGSLIVDCPICGEKHTHGGEKIKPGDNVNLRSHCEGMGSYWVRVLDGDK